MEMSCLVAGSSVLPMLPCAFACMPCLQAFCAFLFLSSWWAFCNQSLSYATIPSVLPVNFSSAPCCSVCNMPVHVTCLRNIFCSILVALLPVVLFGLIPELAVYAETAGKTCLLKACLCLWVVAASRPALLALHLFSGRQVCLGVDAFFLQHAAAACMALRCTRYQPQHFLLLLLLYLCCAWRFDLYHDLFWCPCSSLTFCLLRLVAMP